MEGRDVSSQKSSHRPHTQASSYDLLETTTGTQRGDRSQLPAWITRGTDLVMPPPCLLRSVSLLCRPPPGSASRTCHRHHGGRPSCPSLARFPHLPRRCPPHRPPATSTPSYRARRSRRSRMSNLSLGRRRPLSRRQSSTCSWRSSSREYSFHAEEC